MIDEWGDGTWGSGTWGGTNLQLETLRAEWPFDRVTPEPNTATDDLLRAVSNELTYEHDEIQRVRKQRFVDTATGAELVKLGAEIGVSPQANESEERFQLRVLVAKAVSGSNGTLPTLARVLYVIFDDNTDRCSVSIEPNDPVVQLTVPTAQLDKIPFTKLELESNLQPVLPAGDKLQIITDETWILGESGSQGLGNGGLL